MNKSELTELETNIMNNINRLLNETNKSRKNLSDYLGVSYVTVSRYCLGNNTPKIDVLVKIAKYFNVSIYDLVGVIPEGTQIPLSDEEISLVTSYRQKNDDIKGIVRKILDI